MCHFVESLSRRILLGSLLAMGLGLGACANRSQSSWSRFAAIAGCVLLDGDGHWISEDGAKKPRYLLTDQFSWPRVARWGFAGQSVSEASTLEALAERSGLSPEVLIASVEDYNREQSRGLSPEGAGLRFPCLFFGSAPFRLVLL